ncbi:MAG: ECF transporter S component [bacterium]
MNNAKALTINGEKITTLIQFFGLLGIAVIVPLFHQQTITGPIVNATLFVSTMLLGSQAGILIGLIPSVIALSVGLLPPPLAPMVPFIMIGNTILVLIFDTFFRSGNYWLGVIAAGFLKFVFLFSASSVVINLLLKKEIAQQVSMMMSWPQLITALAGGVLAFLFFKFYKANFK